MVKQPELVPAILSDMDFEAMLEACPDGQWRAMFTEAASEGLRVGGILALEWDDVDFEGSILRVCNKSDHATKSRKNRLIPMSPQIIAALQPLRLGIHKSNLVFTNGVARKFRNNFQREYTKISKRAGLVDDAGKLKYTMHDFRATCATQLQRQGVPIKTAQKILGHASLSTTAKHYTGVEL
jgi:integrase